MERRKFEDDFAKAFKDAGVTPGDNVWTNIELDLERQQGKKMKRRVLFYQMLAAASVTFAMIIAGLGYYAMTSRPAEQIASTTTPANSQNEGSMENQSADTSFSASVRRNSTGSSLNQTETNIGETHAESINQQAAAQDEWMASSSKRNHPLNKATNGTRLNNKSNGEINIDKPEGSPAKKSSSSEDGNNLMAEKIMTREKNDQDYLATNQVTKNRLTPSLVEDKNGSEKLTPAFASRELPKLHHFKVPALTFDRKEENNADPVALMMARLNDLEKELAGTNEKKNNSKSEKLWTTVGFAAGGFNSVNPSISSAPSRASQSLFTVDNTTGVNNQAKASGTAYSAGVSMGTRISDRWVIQGGVNYLTQISNYTADVAFSSADMSSFKAASLNEFADGRLSSENKAIPTAPYSVFSNVEIITLPVQAGYIIVNRKVAFQLNAGVSTDLFLQNTIDPEGEAIQKTTQGAGEDSPYRTFNMSGLIGTELSYRFADRYRLTLNPGLRYPLNSIYKDGTGVNASPLIFDLGLRFRYIFQ